MAQHKHAKMFAKILAVCQHRTSNIKIRNYVVPFMSIIPIPLQLTRRRLQIRIGMESDVSDGIRNSEFGIHNGPTVQCTLCFCLFRFHFFSVSAQCIKITAARCSFYYTYACTYMYARMFVHILFYR